MKQIAYFVADVSKAAARHHTVFRSGPFLVADHIKLRCCQHRGHQATCDHSAAYGQWGEVMVEFVQQNNVGPSAFHDMYPDPMRRCGIHHVAMFVDDLPGAITRYVTSGDPVAMYAEMESGFAFAMIDTVARLGHMTELYQPEPALIDFYATVKSAAVGFDGTEVVRTIRFDS